MVERQGNRQKLAALARKKTKKHAKTSKWHQNGSQNGSEIDEKSFQKSIKNSEGFLEASGALLVDVGGDFGSLDPRK